MRRGHSAPEVAVGKAVDSFLIESGWRRIIMHSGYVPGAGTIGEKGMPDRLYLYYRENGIALVLWIELKPPRYKPRCNCTEAERNQETGRMNKGHECRSCGQKRWAEAERNRGATVLQVSDAEAFAAWYAEAFGWLPLPDRGGQTAIPFEP